jgi:TP901 family phage tail tape measure protein
MATSDLVFRLLGVDAGASRAIAGVGKAAEAAGLQSKTAAERSAEAWGRVGKAFNLVGKLSAVAVLGIGVEGVKAATSFEQAMTRINTQAGVSKSGVAELSKAVLGLAPQVGVGPDELAAGLYHVESAFQSTGITGARAMDILKTAAEGARVGGSDLVDTTNALDAAIVSGIPGVQNFQQAMGALNKIVGSGDMSMQDLADAFGTGAVAVVKNFGLSLNDVGAALATFGDNNIRGADAGTALRMSVMALAKPVASGDKLLQGIGITTGQLARDMAHGGLNQAMKDLVGHMDQAGITGNKVGQFITDAFGKKAGVGLAVLTGQFGRFESKVGDVKAAAGGFANAWAGQQDTLKQKLADLAQSWKVFEIEIGQKIIPILKTTLDYLSKHPGVLKLAAAGVTAFASAWTLWKFGQIIEGLTRMSRAILGVGAASTTAAAESDAANIGGAAAGAASAGRGAALLGGARRLIIPVAVTYAVLEGTGLTSSLSDVIHGDITKAQEDSPKWMKSLASGILGLFGRQLSSVAQLTSAEKGPFNEVMAKYGESAGKRFADALIADKGDIALAWSSVYRDIAKSDPKLFGAQGKQAGNLFSKGMLDAVTATQPFHLALANVNALLDSNTNSLTENSVGAESNRKGLKTLTETMIASARAYADSTGVQSDNTAALRVGVAQILNSASATGLNRQQVADYLNTLIKIPGYKVTTLGLDGAAAAQAQIDGFLQSLAQIPSQVRVPVTAYLTNPNLANSLAGAAAGVSIPGFATGTSSAPRGFAWVGEHGPELMRMRGGEQVITHAKSMSMAGGGSITINVNAINASSFRDQLRSGGLGREIAAEMNRQGLGGAVYN